MKKTITLLMLAIAFLIGAANAEARTYKYKGNIGEYGVTVTLTQYDDDCRQGFGCINYYKGQYTYTKAGNTLKLEGTDWTMDEHTHLDEYTKKVTHSGKWDLEGMVGDNVLRGTFRNLSNGKVFKVYLKRSK